MSNQDTCPHCISQHGVLVARAYAAGEAGSTSFTAIIVLLIAVVVGTLSVRFASGGPASSDSCPPMSWETCIDESQTDEIDRLLAKGWKEIDGHYETRCFKDS